MVVERTGTGAVRSRGRPSASGSGPAVPDEAEVLLRGMEAFAELGYDRTSARELARRLGVSHNFINDRYGSKANFWRTVVDWALSEAQRQRETIPKVGMDDGELVRAIIVQFYQTAVKTPLLGRLLADEFARESERLDYLFDNYVAPSLALVEPAMERLVKAGRVPPVPMDVLFFAVISPVAGLVQLPLASRLGRKQPITAKSQAKTAQRLADLIVDGLLGRP
ncbi:TetR/AcrR family transcriptional regulator [Microtetraspora malaysiensis]|uniref:TetR/AcrR family transcriptional regulator n=1 Tax=Microtetraspora malaysiensis TaxID=161358 RepID=UPI000A0154E6|nr:TetR/AcrR family transcriptional regulator [Microtetraspora malaysiensis]